ncbi:hypothetical protein Rsub_12214 [Raphidocelis subcapitata]|uniref:RNase III domain-containing protein n=1 Tax=Raphidocelis subcapitata TaxID=307507 RepID=A0A2V0PJ67_9CHLO|nr:hypothetical protein Rsub_12214 [Raphidocelis subcapitata]|eukprot:GBF99589.1 hypothetical protein Rsub_12214 [Raphidocelis subcapitata]
MQAAPPRACPLPPPPDLGGAEPRSRWNAASLAYLGDAVWEVYVRTASYREGPWSPRSADAAVRRVSTHALARAYDRLSAGGALTEAEARVLRWGANSATVAAPRHATRSQYKRATGFEVLVAHLYLTDPPRLEALASQLLAPGSESEWIDGAEAAAEVSGGGESSGGEGEKATAALGSDGDGSSDGMAAASGGTGPGAGGEPPATPQQQPRPKPAGFGGAGGKPGARARKK